MLCYKQTEAVGLHALLGRPLVAGWVTCKVIHAVLRRYVFPGYKERGHYRPFMLAQARPMRYARRFAPLAMARPLAPCAPRAGSCPRPARRRYSLCVAQVVPLLSPPLALPPTLRTPFALPPPLRAHGGQAIARYVTASRSRLYVLFLCEGGSEAMGTLAVSPRGETSRAHLRGNMRHIPAPALRLGVASRRSTPPLSLARSSPLACTIPLARGALLLTAHAHAGRERVCIIYYVLRNFLLKMTLTCGALNGYYGVTHTERGCTMCGENPLICVCALLLSSVRWSSG